MEISYVNQKEFTYDALATTEDPVDGSRLLVGTHVTTDRDEV